MTYIARLIEPLIRQALEREKSIFLLGPRQTGKTTLLRNFRADLSVSFELPHIRQLYERDSSLLYKEIQSLAGKSSGARKIRVMLDEVQKIPEVLDIAQNLIDRRRAVFMITGSSARKLRRRSHVNLLPGRVLSFRMDPLTIREIPPDSLKLEDLLCYGSLPGIIGTTDTHDKERELESYVTIYLEEEIRAEAIVRNLGSFSRFLELAASEAGLAVNFSKLSQEIGVSHTTVQSYYQILEDCLIAERIEPLTKSKTRKKLTRTQKYLFFDMGVRRLAAHEGIRPPQEILGRWFEQFVGLELLRLARGSENKKRLLYWRDPGGPEVDWVIEDRESFKPLEVKWTNLPSERDARSLKVFLGEYPCPEGGWIVCQSQREFTLGKNISAIPWQKLPELF